MRTSQSFLGKSVDEGGGAEGVLNEKSETTGGEKLLLKRRFASIHVSEDFSRKFGDEWDLEKSQVFEIDYQELRKELGTIFAVPGGVIGVEGL